MSFSERLSAVISSDELISQLTDGVPPGATDKEYLKIAISRVQDMLGIELPDINSFTETLSNIYSGLIVDNNISASEDISRLQREIASNIPDLLNKVSEATTDSDAISMAAKFLVEKGLFAEKHN